MTKKTISIKNISRLGKKTNHDIPDILADQWVNTDMSKSSSTNHEAIDETRLTISIPTYLHRRIKKYCASHSLSMKEKIIQLFKENFPET